MLHAITTDDLNTMIYPKQCNISLSRWKCMLRQCDNYLKYYVLEYESSCTTVAPKIKFHIYVIFLTCSVHGLLGGGD